MPLKAGRADEAGVEAESAVTAARELVSGHVGQTSYIVDLAQGELLLGDALLALGRSGEARALHESSVSRLEPFAPGTTDAGVLETLATGLLRLGRREDARGPLGELDAMGYAMPELATLRRVAGIEER